jgi:flagellar hook assembly protein FlgD
MLPSAGLVRVAVYDPLGREVRRLRWVTATPGSHSVTWDRTDARGRQVRPGVYFCRVETEGQSAVAKITIID